jgi:hypothetical protein
VDKLEEPQIENYLGQPELAERIWLSAPANKPAGFEQKSYLPARVRGEFSAGKNVCISRTKTKIIARVTPSHRASNIIASVSQGRRVYRSWRYYGASQQVAFCTGEHVISWRQPAAQGLHFSRNAREVTMIVREETLKEGVSAIRRLHLSTKNIEVLANHEVTPQRRKLESITLRNKKDRRRKQLNTHWLLFASEAHRKRNGP